MDQREFDFDSGDDSGLCAWIEEQERLKETIRSEWGLPIGRRVEISLASTDGGLAGLLELAGAAPARLDRRRPLRLRIGRIEFSSAEITRCVAIG